MENIYENIFKFLSDIKLFTLELFTYMVKKFHLSFVRFESGKGVFVTALYRQRGKMARRLIHSGMVGLAAVGMMIAPIIAEEFPGRNVNPWDIPSPSSIVSQATINPYTTTLVSEKVRAESVEYTVVDGDTVSSIAEKFGVSSDTVRWQNDLAKKKAG